MRRKPGICLAVLSIPSSFYAAATLVKQEHQTNTPWIPNEYPDPDLDQRACRTLFNRFCDPDLILKDADVQVVEGYLKRDRSVSCRVGNEPERMIDVQLAVALVEKVNVQVTCKVKK